MRLWMCHFTLLDYIPRVVFFCPPKFFRKDMLIRDGLFLAVGWVPITTPRYRSTFDGGPWETDKRHLRSLIEREQNAVSSVPMVLHGRDESANK